MKVFFAYQGIQEKYFLEFDVSSSCTVEELMQLEEIKKITKNQDTFFRF